MEKSKLVLGTVQLGMPYGVGNTSGQPDREEAFRILDYAYAGGINTFDTASAYGSAEALLGEWIASRSLEKDVYVITKIRGDAAEGVRADIESSLQRLQLEKLDGCLLHMPQAMHDPNTVGDLEEAKRSGVIAHIGVSIYEPQDALRAVEAGIEYIQVPYNVFDQRLDRTDFFQKAASAGSIVFARSVFLQGLLLMEPKNVPAHLFAALPHLERFRGLATAHGASPLQAALSYVLQRDGIDHVVFGVESLNQLNEILATKEMNEKLLEELNREFKHIDESILNPALWKK